jgi:hypothetical protein
VFIYYRLYSCANMLKKLKRRKSVAVRKYILHINKKVYLIIQFCRRFALFWIAWSASTAEMTICVPARQTMTRPRAWRKCLPSTLKRKRRSSRVAPSPGGMRRLLQNARSVVCSFTTHLQMLVPEIQTSKSEVQGFFISSKSFRYCGF